MKIIRAYYNLWNYRNDGLVYLMHTYHRKKAWILVHEETCEHNSHTRKFIGILNGRKSASYVRDLVENLFTIEHASLGEQLEFSGKQDSPFRAEYGTVPIATNRSIYYQCIIHCGFNPYLYAFYVKDLKLIGDSNSPIVKISRYQPRPINKKFYDETIDSSSVPFVSEWIYKEMTQDTSNDGLC